MTAPAPPSDAMTNMSQRRCTGPSDRRSSRKFSERQAAFSYRQHFKATWKQICDDNFDGPADVADCFKIDTDTAKNWCEGRNAPQGWAVGWVLKKAFARSQHLGEAVQRALREAS